MSGKWDDFIGDRIKALRILHNSKQEELGKVLNLPKQAISSIEKGKRKISIEELVKISDFFVEPLSAFIEKDFKFSYFPKNKYGSFPKFTVDFLTDLESYLLKLVKEQYDNESDFNESKTLILKINKAMQEILDLLIKNEGTDENI